MNAFNIKAAGLALAAALATTGATLFATGAPAAAAPIVVEGVQAPWAAVSHADLNLASPAGVRTLNARVRHAAEKLCTEPSTKQIEVFVAGKACVRATVQQAQPQIARAIDRQRSAQIGAGSQ